MNTESTPPTDRVASLLVAQRTAIAWVMIALGLAAAGAGIFCASKLVSKPAAAEDADKAKDTADPESEPATAPVPYRTEYTVGVLCGILGAVAGLGIGAWILAAPPKATEAERTTDARVATLMAGGAVGLALMVAGLAFFIVWFPLLAKWLDEKVTPPGAWKVVAALLVFLVGAGLAFLAAQPARAEERNAPTLRRLVYGLNFALGVLLLLVVLIAGNAFAALKVPAKLDTTESGFYTLSDATKEYLIGLSEPVTAYVLIPDSGDRLIADIRQLLTSCQAVNPQRFRVRYLTDAMNKNEIRQLQEKHPSADLVNSYGILLTAGENEARSAYIRENDFIEQERDPTGRGGRAMFRGEAKLVQELLILTETKAKPVIYFTQSNNELAIATGVEGGDPRRVASAIRTALEKNYADVRPLDATENKIPDDANLIVVADPTQPLPERQVTAIREFVTGGQKGDKKGKLIVLAGSHAGPDRKMTATGLEGLLGEMGVQLGTNFLYHEPSQMAGPTTALVVMNPTLVRSRNSLATAFSGQVIPVDDVRIVQVPRTPPPGPFAAQALMYSTGRLSWTEPERTDPIASFDELLKAIQAGDREVIRRMEATDSSRPVGAIVSEGETPRAVVIGAGGFFADETGRQFRGNNVQADLLAAAANWLRDRPAVANIPNKSYGIYTLSRTASEVQLVWLPVGVTLTGILALGLGVWLLRRM